MKLTRLGVQIATIQAADQGRFGTRRLVPVARAALDERELVGLQFALGPWSDTLLLTPNRILVQLLTQGQDLGQQVEREPIVHQGRDLALQASPDAIAVFG